ncbi:MAG TPA: AarF/UbiB family protein, partial [Candidatus Tumulicola sp.]|nr:AarF/UbiB family protein [Candidatus Tumulicola sp.]
PGIEVPEVVRELSTSQILTMTRAGGSRPEDVGRMTPRRRVAAAGRIARFVLEPALVHGVFHADPHEGNVLVRRNGTIAVLDFGMVGRLSDDLRRGLADMFAAMQRGDARRLTDRLVQLAPPARPVDRSLLVQRLQRLLERYFGDSAERPHIGKALGEIMELVRTYGLRSPGSLALLFKAVALADGTVLAITPDKPLTQYLEPIAKRVRLARMSAGDWGERARLSAMDVKELSLELPHHADRVLTDLELGNLRVWTRIEDAEPMLGRLELMVEHANATMIAAACVVGVTVLFAVYRPPWWQTAAAWAFWIALLIALVVTVRTGLRVFFHRRVRR